MPNFQRRYRDSRGVNQEHCSNICSYKCDPPTKQLPSSCSKWAISLILPETSRAFFSPSKFSILKAAKWSIKVTITRILNIPSASSNSPQWPGKWNDDHPFGQIIIFFFCSFNVGLTFIKPINKPSIFAYIVLSYSEFSGVAYRLDKC